MIDGELSTDHQTKALRAQPALSYRGPFRVYFNRKEDAPRVVSIDNGSHTWEIVCKTVKISGRLASTYSPMNEYPNPVFTLEGFGEVTVDGNGNATIA